MDYTSSANPYTFSGIIATKSDLYNVLAANKPAGYIIPLIGYARFVMKPRSINVYYRIAYKDGTFSSVISLNASSTLTLDILDTYHSIAFASTDNGPNWYGIQYQLFVSV